MTVLLIGFSDVATFGCYSIPNRWEPLNINVILQSYNDYWGTIHSRTSFKGEQQVGQKDQNNFSTGIVICEDI